MTRNDNSVTIDRIVALSDAPDGKAYRRYLGTLPPRLLNERLAQLTAEQTKPQRAAQWPRTMRLQNELSAA